jgi:tetratricopeptide (TPR) repeat protein
MIKMHRLWHILVITLFMFLFNSGGSVSAMESFADIVNKTQESVVTIFAQNADGTIIQGSGFFIDEEGNVVTNYHVVEKATKILVKQETWGRYNGKVIANDQESDLAILGTDAKNKFYRIKYLKISKKPPVVGDRIIVIGSPLGLEQTVSDGLVSALRPISGFGDIIQISAPVSRGSSGGPVVNLKGDVIGVATFVIVGGQNLNFAIPGYKIIELISRSKNLTKKPDNDLVDTYLRHGTVYANKGDYSTAISYYDKAIEINPNSYPAYIMRGMMFYYMGSFVTSTGCFSKAIQVRPDSAEAYNNRGMAYLAHKDYQEAKEDFKKAVELDQTQVEPHNNLGMIYMNENDYDNALLHLKKALELDPRNGPSYFNIAIAYEKMGDHDNAIKFYKKAIDVKDKLSQGQIEKAKEQIINLRNK